ncbi:DedA family protein [Sphingobacterium wenxiniae]|uniref:Membrane-associated protein n=1 Tax=Sphingobacterium wenxiniae TaxID=683125 RepID=A0A1I6SB53_9SPHI|nr:DedA family protein [Sphingobacterium wenxiniae]SFS74201.1 membrane-associated protein [Sphingobacterium wenxiniae]
MELIYSVIDFVLHIDKHLVEIVNEYQMWTYLILFLIIFIETGVVVMPFLPGDSLLFAAGMLAAQPNDLNVWVMVLLLLIAAITGDSLNYSIGKRFGMGITKFKIFGKQMVREEQIEKTHAFYAKYGSKTIVIARFVPIVRTLAPFVGGIGRMHYGTFLTYNVVGAVLWVVGITFAGYFLGNIPIIRDNFSKVVLLIIFISILPIIFEVVKEKMNKKKDV